jgi:hypothetical protein
VEEPKRTILGTSKRQGPNAAKTILRFLAGPEAVAVVEAKGIDRVATR